MGRIRANDTVSSDLSPYGKFHVAFLGYRFRNVRTGKTLVKGQVWDKDPKSAMFMAENQEAGLEYELIDSPGWRNGILQKRVGTWK